MVYGQCSLSENSRTDFHDGHRTGRSSTSGTVVNTARVEELIFEESNRNSRFNRRTEVIHRNTALPTKERARFTPRQNFKVMFRWDKRISVFPHYNEI